MANEQQVQMDQHEQRRHRALQTAISFYQQGLLPQDTKADELLKFAEKMETWFQGGAINAD